MIIQDSKNKKELAYLDGNTYVISFLLYIYISYVINAQDMHNCRMCHIWQWETWDLILYHKQYQSYWSVRCDDTISCFFTYIILWH